MLGPSPTRADPQIRLRDPRGRLHGRREEHRTLGVGLDDDLGLDQPENLARFMRALVVEEHSNASDQYPNDLIRTGVRMALGGERGGDLPLVPSNKRHPLQPASQVVDLDRTDPELLDRFKQVQNQFGRSLPIVSAFRDPGRNKRAGGAKGSQHVHGTAIDIDVADLSRKERLRLIQLASASGITGIGVYENSLHFDIGNRRAWGPSHGRESVPSGRRRRSRSTSRMFSFRPRSTDLRLQ